MFFFDFYFSIFFVWNISDHDFFFEISNLKFFVFFEIWIVSFLLKFFIFFHHIHFSCHENVANIFLMKNKCHEIFQKTWKISRSRKKKPFICNINYFTRLLLLDNQSINKFTHFMKHRTPRPSGLCHYIFHIIERFIFSLQTIVF